jgi:hypothetical protein
VVVIATSLNPCLGPSRNFGTKRANSEKRSTRRHALALRRTVEVEDNSRKYCMRRLKKDDNQSKGRLKDVRAS